MLLCGIVVFVWSGLEDSASWPVALLGTGVSVLAVLWWLLRHQQSRPVREILLLALVAGAMTGTGASLATAGLMFFKNARHAHLFPDFPVGQISGILQLAPVWGAAGAFFYFGLAILWFAFKD